MAELKSELLFEVSADIDMEEAQELGANPQGNRRIAYIKGGTIEGPKLKGEILPGGGDWVLVRPDGARRLDVRTTVRTGPRATTSSFDQVKSPGPQPNGWCTG